MPDPIVAAVVALVTLVVFFALIVLLISLLRRALWLLSPVFFMIDELMWFLYNPLRGFMKDREAGANRFFFYLFTMFLVKPVWQVSVWVITTPLRVITALYFDVLVYLFVMLSDTTSELFNPKYGSMRHRKGFGYLWRWIAFFPVRLGWLLLKNILALVDATMMFIISVIWPTFTMYHGTSKNNVIDIAREGRWLVGSGNFAGSGIYFGRSPRVAISYSKGSRHGDEGRVIIARVTLTMLRNCATLRSKERQNVARAGEGGAALAKAIKFPYFATEFWRTDYKWWEYCILQGGKDGQFVKSWRIRPIGFVHIKGESTLSGSLERLWGGQSHYCLNPMNIVMAVGSLAFILFLLGNLVT
jgi:hypothetical protein